jgi:hypothetical protein
MIHPFRLLICMASIFMLTLACSFPGEDASPAIPTGNTLIGTIASIPAQDESKASSTSPSTTTMAIATAFTGSMPGDLPARIAYVDDISEKANQGANGAAGGDNFAENIYERPFNKDLSYRPDLDITGTSFSKDPNWFYVTIALAGQNVADGKMGANYGVELDVNKDGRGEFVVWLLPTFSNQWTRSHTKIYSTTTHMVGGTHPVLSDAPGWTGVTYDKILFDGATDNTNNGAWARVSPSNANNIEIAFSSAMVGNPAEFLWSAWADDGIKDPSKFDYNDIITKVEAGSPYKSLADFPPKAIWAVDNTCRYWVGFTPTTLIPGSCQESPTATPKPTITPTKRYTSTLRAPTKTPTKLLEEVTGIAPPHPKG